MKSPPSSSSWPSRHRLSSPVLSAAMPHPDRSVRRRDASSSRTRTVAPGFAPHWVKRPVRALSRSAHATLSGTNVFSTSIGITVINGTTVTPTPTSTTPPSSSSVSLTRRPHPQSNGHA
ncbi:hypothetical protein BCR44DRAFT_1516878, partial [Catenaria anguillulae PL171]